MCSAARCDLDLGERRVDGAAAVRRDAHSFLLAFFLRPLCRIRGRKTQRIFAPKNGGNSGTIFLSQYDDVYVTCEWIFFNDVRQVLWQVVHVTWCIVILQNPGVQGCRERCREGVRP